MIVQNMHSLRSGKPVVKQFIIKINGLTIFQSYSSVIAVTKWNMENILLDPAVYNYSPTTSKYLYQFLGFKKEGIEERRKNGSLLFTSLNDPSYNRYEDGQFIDLYKYVNSLIDTIPPVAVSK